MVVFFRESTAKLASSLVCGTTERTPVPYCVEPNTIAEGLRYFFVCFFHTAVPIRNIGRTELTETFPTPCEETADGTTASAVNLTVERMFTR